jgi:hypothetical protein
MFIAFLSTISSTTTSKIHFGMLVKRYFLHQKQYKAEHYSTCCGSSCRRFAFQDAEQLYRLVQNYCFQSVTPSGHPTHRATIDQFLVLTRSFDCLHDEGYPNMGETCSSQSSGTLFARKFHYRQRTIDAITATNCTRIALSMNVETKIF